MMMWSNGGLSDWQRTSLASAPFLVARQRLSTTSSPLLRNYSSPPPPPPQGGTIPPPTTKGPPAPSPGAASLTGASNAAARAFKPSFLVLAPTFLFTHVTVAWALIPPVYLLLRSTNLSNTLLAGPQGAWFLSRKAPEWIPDTLIDSLVGGVPANASSSRRAKMENRPTVEEIIERLARRAVRIFWNVGSTAYSGFKGGAGEEEALTNAAMRQLRGGLGMEKQEVKEKAGGIKDKVLGYTRKQAQGVAGDIKFGQIRDGVAAWVLVKVLLPLRIPLSLFLTPKVARGLAKLYRK
ncbi:hypothetical protein CBS101457_005919 [Exobasidium rhododendri]|nr:hypothetical protein CBS101457_005919 [Exobasidium rhododendri]